MSMIDWLIIPRVQRLLAALLLHPERSYSVRELVRIAGGNSAGVQSTIGDMVRAGLLSDERVGNQRRLQVKTTFPLYAELRAISVKTFGVVDLLRAAIEPFRQKLECAFLFGSTVTGGDTAGSDIDFMLVGEVEDYVALTNALHDIGDEVGRPIHFHLYGRDEWSQLLAKDPVIRAIADGPRIEVLENGLQ